LSLVAKVAAAAAIIVVVVVVAIALILVVVMEPNAQASQHNYKTNSSFLLFRTVEFVREF
jgi:preprotein translocase subunit SecG